jgi:hypothetical protein
MHRISAFVLAAMAAATPAAAQEITGRPGPRLQLPRDWEVALARSAAPPSVSATARVWYFAKGTYIVADSGTSTAACYVGRSWPEALEPQCFDEEGARTILPMEMRTAELLHAGRSQEAVDREIADGLAAGRYRIPQRLAMSWMMSAAQVLYSDDGRRVGAWRPHVMIYYPYLTAAGVGTGANQDLTAGIIVSPGKPGANLMIVVQQAITPPSVPPSGAPPRP